MQYGNNISAQDAHSNQYAQGSASDQSFSERLDIERHRERVAAYRNSSIARASASRGQYSRPKPRSFKPIVEKKSTRQEMNANHGFVPEQGDAQNAKTNNAIRPQAMFREPVARGYNPYS